VTRSRPHMAWLLKNQTHRFDP